MTTKPQNHEMGLQHIQEVLVARKVRIKMRHCGSTGRTESRAGESQAGRGSRTYGPAYRPLTHDGATWCDLVADHYRQLGWSFLPDIIIIRATAFASCHRQRIENLKNRITKTDSLLLGLKLERGKTRASGFATVRGESKVQVRHHAVSGCSTALLQVIPHE